MKSSKKFRFPFIHHFLHDMKFKNKFIITNLMLVLVPTLVLLSFMSNRFSRVIETNTIESERALVSQTADTLGSTVDKLKLTMDNILTLTELGHGTLNYNKFSVFSKSATDFTEYRTLFENLEALQDQQLVQNIRIYFPTTIRIPRSVQGLSDIIQPISNVRSSYWHGIFDGRPYLTDLLCPDFYLTNAESSSLGENAYIIKLPNIHDEKGECAYIAVYFSQEYLQNILHNNITGSDSVYYIINSRNSIVASSDPGLAGTYFIRYEEIPEKLGNALLFTTQTILDEPLYMGYREIAETDWRLVSVIPASVISRQSSQIMSNSLYLYLVFVGLAFVTALILSGSMANRLSKVVDTMNESRDTTLTKINLESDADEIGQLAINYNLMVDRINALAEEQTQTAEKLKISEVRALQAQINPHFLYNMLDMVNWLSQSGKQEEVSIAVQTLSKFYKLTLSQKNIYTSIGEELKHVELYVKLQNMRYENKINFFIDVPSEIMDMQIPKLVLQPIVENSILHGIFERESKSGEIVIMAWAEGDDIVFVVSDDGMGIPAEKLPSILSGSGKSSSSGSNIAIYNTHQRLQLIYGERYGLHYESTYGLGTEVQVRIPSIHFEE